MPTLSDAFEDYNAASPNPSNRTDELYCYEVTAAEKAPAQLHHWISFQLAEA